MVYVSQWLQYKILLLPHQSISAKQRVFFIKSAEGILTFGTF